ncbi:MAG: hypothetical protein R3F07_08505 [Opitutaceae bacterium]
MRANRLLGANLVENNLVRIEDLEKANERLFQIIETGTDRDASLLHILIRELNVLTEENILSFLVDERGVGIIDLEDVEMADDLRLEIKPDICWATWTVPFDREEDFHYVATCYYMSDAVRQFWEKELGGSIVWFATTMKSLTQMLERVENERLSNAPAIAAS